MMQMNDQHSNRVSSQLIENALKSNTSTLKFFMSNNLKTVKEELLEIINHEIFQQKMKNLLRYYKPRESDDSSILASKHLLGKQSLTRSLTELVITVSDILVSFLFNVKLGAQSYSSF
jgi:hypothetical protein